MQNRIIIYLLPIYVSALSYIGIGFNLSDTGWDFDGSQHVQRAYPLGNFSHQGSAASQSSQRPVPTKPALLLHRVVVPRTSPAYRRGACL